MTDTEKKYGYALQDREGHLCLGIPKTGTDGRHDATLGVNWIRYYPLPEPEDLASLRDLLHALQRRFTTHVAHGAEVQADHTEKLERKLQIAEQGSFGEEACDILRGDLAIAYQKRAVAAAEAHLDQRIALGLPHDDPQVYGLLQQAGAWLQQSTTHAGKEFQNLRREDGSKDVDRVIGEMLTEALHIINGVRPNGRAAFENIFHRNRFHKVSLGWDEIDRTEESMQKLIGAHPPLKEGQLPVLGAPSKSLGEQVHDLAAIARERSALARSDDDYDRADIGLRVARSRLLNFELPENAPPDARSAHDLLTQGVHLVYDMAKIRLGRPASVRQFGRDVGQFLGEPEQGKGHGVG